MAARIVVMLAGVSACKNNCQTLPSCKHTSWLIAKAYEEWHMTCPFQGKHRIRDVVTQHLSLGVVQVATVPCGVWDWLGPGGATIRFRLEESIFLSLKGKSNVQMFNPWKADQFFCSTFIFQLASHKSRCAFSEAPGHPESRRPLACCPSTAAKLGRLRSKIKTRVTTAVQCVFLWRFFSCVSSHCVLRNFGLLNCRLRSKFTSFPCPPHTFSPSNHKTKTWGSETVHFAYTQQLQTV